MTADAVPMLTLMADPQSSRLIKQGAEAKVYIVSLFPEPTWTARAATWSDAGIDGSNGVRQKKVLLKHRFPKTYRHPSLSSHLTASRTTAEARALVRCARAGVNTPRILCVDEEQGVLGLEIIDGYSVREVLGGGSEGSEESAEDAAGTEIPPLSDGEAMDVMKQVGIQLARMHQAHIIHGDLTTSNMMVRRRKGAVDVVGHHCPLLDSISYSVEASPFQILIDFGLSSNSTSSEDKAVDLYVLQRAFASTHPHSEHLFAEIVRIYEDVLENQPVPYDPKVKAEKGTVTGPTHWREVKRKLEEGERARERSMCP